MTLSSPIAASNPADALTPASLIVLLHNAESGQVAVQARLFDAMEDRDAKVASLIQTRKAGVLSHGWELNPADDTPTAQGVCDDVRAVLKNLPANRSTDKIDLSELTGFDQTLVDLLDAVGKGVAVCELIWDRGWDLKNILWRPLYEFSFEATELKGRDEHGDARSLNPLNYVVHYHQARSGLPGQAPLLRSVARIFLVRNYGWKDWLGAAERAGFPGALGTYPVGATEDQKGEVWRMVQAMSTAFMAALEEGTSLKLIESKLATGGQNIFERLVKEAGDEMTLAILGQLLSSGGAEGGSYALGRVHNLVRQDLAEEDARRLVATVQKQIIRPLVYGRHGANAPQPRFTIMMKRAEDLVQLALTIQRLVNAGARVPVEWVNRKYGIRIPAKGEPILRPRGLEAIPDVQG